MAQGLNVGDNVDLWDLTFDIKRVQLEFGKIKDFVLVPIFCPFGIENCIIVSPSIMVTSFAQQNLFCLMQSGKWCGRVVGTWDYFWPTKDVFGGWANFNVSSTRKWTHDSNYFEVVNKFRMKMSCIMWMPTSNGINDNMMNDNLTTFT